MKAIFYQNLIRNKMKYGLFLLLFGLMFFNQIALDLFWPIWISISFSKSIGLELYKTYPISLKAQLLGYGFVDFILIVFVGVLLWIVKFDVSKTVSLLAFTLYFVFTNLFQVLLLYKFSLVQWIAAFVAAIGSLLILFEESFYPMETFVYMVGLGIIYFVFNFSWLYFGKRGQFYVGI